MGLEFGGIEGLRRRYIEHASARPAQVLEPSAQHMKGAVQIDVHHGLEPIGRHPQRGRQKITRRARDQHIKQADGIARFLQRPRNRGGITHVGAVAFNLCAMPAEHVDRLGYTFGVAAGDGHVGAGLGKGGGNAQVDAAAAAGHKYRLALKTQWNTHGVSCVGDTLRRACSCACRWRQRILPVPDLGRSSMKRTLRGAL